MMQYVYTLYGFIQQQNGPLIWQRSKCVCVSPGLCFRQAVISFLVPQCVYCVIYHCVFAIQPRPL